MSTVPSNKHSQLFHLVQEIFGSLAVQVVITADLRACQEGPVSL